MIPTEELQPVIDEISHEIDVRARALVAAGKLSRPFDEESFETRLARISQETDKIALDIWNGFLHGPAIFHLIGKRSRQIRERHVSIPVTDRFGLGYAAPVNAG